MEFNDFKHADFRDVKTCEVKKESLEKLKEERAIVHYISTPDQDWGGDVVDPKGMDASNFEKHKTVFYNHNYDQPIAKNLWLKKKDEGVLVKTQFATTMFADDIYQLHLEGIISTWSIGWQPSRKNGKMVEGALEYDDKKGITYINKWDLVEYSSAPLAMNPNALDQMKTMVKSYEAKQLVKGYEEIARIENIVNEQSKTISELGGMITELTKLLNAKVGTEDLESLEAKILDLTQLIENKQAEIKESTSVEIVGKAPNIDDIVSKSVAGAISRITGKKIK